jgi:hypothetical protein
MRNISLNIDDFIFRINEIGNFSKIHFLFMKNRLPLTLQFIINCFVIAVFINAIVSTAQVMKEKDLTFFASVPIFLFMLSTSALFFAVVSIFLYLVGLLAGMGREKTFWLLMTTGIIITVVAYRIFKEIFYNYAEPGYIAGIGAFSIMVSLASQYQLFHGIEPVNKKPVVSEQ